MIRVTMYDMDGRKVWIEVPEALYCKIEQEEKWFVVVSPWDGTRQLVEVTPEVYALCDEARRARERRRYEFRKHGDERPLEHPAVAEYIATQPLEQLAAHRELLSCVFEVLGECTPIQRRRFYLHNIMGYNCAEISRMEQCSASCARQAVTQVKRKLKKLFQDNSL